MADIKIIENCSEIGAGTRGAGLGIGALQVVARQRENNFFSRYERFSVSHQNDLLDEPTVFKHAKRIDGLAAVYQNTCEVLGEVFEKGNFPLILSGDHACAAGTIAGIKKANPDSRIGVIWIDAHADLHTPYTTPSGNIHGMPLAIALGEDNLESAVNGPVSEEIQLWNELKMIGGKAKKIEVQDLVFIGVRDTEEPEDEYIERKGIKNYTVDEVRTKGVDSVISEIGEKLNDCDYVYVSFDVDSMDCDLVSKGTGTPVPNGLTPEEASQFVSELAAWEKTCCVEFVEINPCLDNKTNKMAEVAFEILTTCAKTIENKI